MFTHHPFLASAFFVGCSMLGGLFSAGHYSRARDRFLLSGLFGLPAVAIAAIIDTTRADNYLEWFVLGAFSMALGAMAWRPIEANERADNYKEIRSYDMRNANKLLPSKSFVHKDGDQ